MLTRSCKDSAACKCNQNGKFSATKHVRFDAIGRLTMKLPLKRLVPPNELQLPKACLAKHGVCGLIAFLAFVAFLFAGCGARPPAESPGPTVNTSGNTSTDQIQRQSPFYWGTNAILYDTQDANLIGSLGNPGKVGARV